MWGWRHPSNIPTSQRSIRWKNTEICCSWFRNTLRERACVNGWNMEQSVYSGYWILVCNSRMLWRSCIKGDGSTTRSNLPISGLQTPDKPSCFLALQQRESQDFLLKKPVCLLISYCTCRPNKYAVNNWMRHLIFSP